MSKTGMKSTKPIIWTPQPKQAVMQARPEYEALYGGAAGGGKTDYLVIEALRQVEIPWYKGLILRKTFPQLKEVVDKSFLYYRQAFPRAKYNQSMHRWTFPSGAKIEFGSLQHETDKYKYQGQAYDFIGFDELTHFQASEYEYLKSRNRPNGPGTKVYIRSTANPGGVGHGWVKDRFVSAGKPGETITDVTRIVTPEGIQYKAQSRVYIPASVFDNKKLIENDPGYVTRLALLPTAERNALLYGDWDSFSGQVFGEFKNNPDGYQTRRWSHVIDPFRIPEHWLIYRSYDFGYAKPFSVGWTAVDHDGCMYRIKELYGCKRGAANVGICIEPHEQARRIREMEMFDPILQGHEILPGAADPAIWDESRGQSIAQMMAEEGVFFVKGDHARIAGKMQCHYRLAFDENGYAMFYVFRNCENFIRTIPSLVYDDKHAEDIDTDGEDHIYDEWRYTNMTKPIAARMNMQDPVPEFDPLNMYRDRFKMFGG